MRKKLTNRQDSRRCLQRRVLHLEARLELCTDTLTDISTLPRGGRAKRLAGALLRLLECMDKSARCQPNCGHTKSEHRAFDRGADLARRIGPAAANPYNPETEQPEWDAWENGASVGRRDYESKRQNTELRRAGHLSNSKTQGATRRRLK